MLNKHLLALNNFRYWTRPEPACADDPPNHGFVHIQPDVPLQANDAQCLYGLSRPLFPVNSATCVDHKRGKRDAQQVIRQLARCHYGTQPLAGHDLTPVEQRYLEAPFNDERAKFYARLRRGRIYNPYSHFSRFEDHETYVARHLPEKRGWNERLVNRRAVGRYVNTPFGHHLAQQLPTALPWSCARRHEPADSVLRGVEPTAAA